MKIKNEELRGQIARILSLTDKGKSIELSEEGRDIFVAYLLKTLSEVFEDNVEITQKDVEKLADRLLGEQSPIIRLIQVVAEWLAGRI